MIIISTIINAENWVFVENEMIFFQDSLMNSIYLKWKSYI